MTEASKLSGEIAGVPDAALGAAALEAFNPIVKTVGTVDGLTLGGGGKEHEWDHPNARYNEKGGQPPLAPLEPLA